MGKETKVVLDTNILVSALGWGGLPKRLFDLFVEDSMYGLVISQEQIKELDRVLNYDKFGFDKIKVKNFMELVCQISEIVHVSGTLGVVKEDPSDDMILESAIVSKAGFVVTGDGHLLRIREYLWIRIMRVAEFMGEHGRGKVAS